MSPTESLAIFKKFLDDASKVRSMPSMLRCIDETYEKLLPGCCFCLWLLDREKHGICRLIYQPRQDCQFKSPSMVPDDQEPISSWIRERESCTIPPSGPQRSDGHKPPCYNCTFHYTPLGSKQGLPLLLTICCPAGHFPSFDAFRDIVDLISATALQIFERVRADVESTLLAKIANSGNQSRSKEEFLKTVVSEIRNALSAKGCTIFLFDDKSQKLALAATTGIVTPAGEPLNHVEYELGEGLTGWIGQRRRVVRFFDTTDKSELSAIDPSGKLRVSTKSMEGLLDEDTRPRQFLGLPILAGAASAREAKLIGVLRLHKKHHGVAFLPHDEDLARAVCDVLAPAVERWNLAERDSTLTDSLLKVIRTIHATDDTETILTTIVKEAKNIFGGYASTLFLKKPGEDVLTVKAEDGFSHSELGLELSIETGLVGLCARTLEIIAAPDIRKAPEYKEALPEVRSEICAPIILEGECRGVLNVASDRVGTFYPDDKGTFRIIKAYTEQIAVALHRADVAHERAILQEKLVRNTELVTAGHVASGVAHELKNGLATIVGLATNLERDPTIKAKKANIENLDRLRQHTKALFELAKRLTDLSKLGEPIKDIVYLNDVMADGMSLLDGVIRNSDMVPDIYLDPALSRPASGYGNPIVIDQRHIIQVLTNLVLNAIDASHQRQVIKIRTCNLSDEWVQFSVQDFGVGIAPEDKRHVFEMFRTTKPNGFGVGLPVAQILVKDHGGDIEVESKYGAGTTFTVKLPK